MKKPALAVQGLVAAIDKKIILKKITFKANQGEFIGIIGPNGAGKSTLLKTVRGILKPAGGEIKVFDKDLKEFSNKQIACLIAYMQQNINLDFGFTALETVLAGRYCYLNWWENEGEEDYKIAKKYMAFMGVCALAQKSVRQISGGERQRIFLARVLAQETPLIFLDEPTSNLDLNYQEEIFRYCRIISSHAQTQDKKLVIMVAHDVRMAAKFCTRLILLSGGEIIADGPPEKVVTAQNLKNAYGFEALVFKDQISGNLDIHVYQNKGTATTPEKVYILGSGGESSEWIRLFFEKGLSLSGGIFRQGEIDAETAKIFGVKAQFIPNHAKITQTMLKLAKKEQEETDWTFLPELFYHSQNLYLLELALLAKQVAVIEDRPIEGRDFSGGRAKNLYEKLLSLPQVKRFGSAEFLKFKK